MASESQPGVPSLTLAPLPQAATTLVTVTPQFLQSYSDHLGNHLTPDDGFDTLLNDPLSAIGTESGALDSLGSVAAEVASAPGNFTPGNLSAIAQDLATFNTNGDTIIGANGAAVAPPASSPATPAGEPTSPAGGDAGDDKQPRGDSGVDGAFTDYARVFDNVL